MRKEHILRTIKNRAMTSKFGPKGQEVIAGEENYIVRAFAMCTSTHAKKSLGYLDRTRRTSMRDVNMYTKYSHFRNLGVKGRIILKGS